MRKTVEDIKLEISKWMDWIEENTLANALYEKLIEARFELENGYTMDRAYKPEFGDNRVCVCGHPYYRHFDTYEEMYPVGCKYCCSGGELIPNPDDPQPKIEDQDALQIWYERQKFDDTAKGFCNGFKEKV